MNRPLVERGTGEREKRSFSWCRGCLINWRAANFCGDNFIFVSFTRRCNSCRRSKCCWSLYFGLSSKLHVLEKSWYHLLHSKFAHCSGLLNWKLNSQDEQLVAHKLSNLDRRSFLLAQGEILVIQMIALAQRCLGHCQPARSYFTKRQRPAPYLFSYRRSRTFYKIDNEARAPFLCFLTE